MDPLQSILLSKLYHVLQDKMIMGVKKGTVLFI